MKADGLSQFWKELEEDFKNDGSEFAGFAARWDGYHRKWSLLFPPTSTTNPDFRGSAEQRFESYALIAADKLGIEGDYEALTFWLELLANWEAIKVRTRRGWKESALQNTHKAHVTDKERQTMAETGQTLSQLRAAMGLDYIIDDEYRQPVEPLSLVEYAELPNVFEVSRRACLKLHELEQRGKLPALATSAADRDQDLVTALEGIKQGFQAKYIDRAPYVTPQHVKESAQLSEAKIRDEIERRQAQGETIAANELEAFDALIEFTRKQAEDNPVTREPNTTKRRLRLVADAWGFYCGALKRKNQLLIHRIWNYEGAADFLVDCGLCPFDVETTLPPVDGRNWFKFGGYFYRKGYVRIVAGWLDKHGPGEFRDGDSRNRKAKPYDRARGVIHEIIWPTARPWESEYTKIKKQVGLAAANAEFKRLCSRVEQGSEFWRSIGAENNELLKGDRLSPKQTEIYYSYEIPYTPCGTWSNLQTPPGKEEDFPEMANRAAVGAGCPEEMDLFAYWCHFVLMFVLTKPVEKSGLLYGSKPEIDGLLPLLKATSNLCKRLSGLQTEKHREVAAPQRYEEVVPIRHSAPGGEAGTTKEESAGSDLQKPPKPKRLTQSVHYPDADQLVKKIMETKALNQTQLGTESGISPRTLHSFRTTGKISPDYFKKLAHLAGTTAEELLAFRKSSGNLPI